MFDVEPIQDAYEPGAKPRLTAWFPDSAEGDSGVTLEVYQNAGELPRFRLVESETVAGQAHHNVFRFQVVKTGAMEQ